jgi:hypothetical protein
MNNHWQNLLIVDQPSRRTGTPCASEAHATTRRDVTSKYRDREMGVAFCDRGHINLPAGYSLRG